jgi:small subunit ribosomal protein S9
MDQETASSTEQDSPGTAVAGDEAPVLDIGSEAAEYERSTGTMRGRIDRTGAALGTGRRKTSVARVRVRDGKGTITVNGREMTEFFPMERDQQLILAPLKATGNLKTVDVWVRVDGGGPTGQAGAVVLGVARALQAKYPESHHLLSDGGFLTRDGRMVERKKYGRKKARRSFQFSKR